MNVTMCTNNHYFDSDMYDVCPICGAGVKANNFSDSGKKSSGSPNSAVCFIRRKNAEERAAEPVSGETLSACPSPFHKAVKNAGIW